MTKIVGIDFGTANVRITQWDVDSEANPVSMPIGEGGVSWMPSVIAFQKRADGEIGVEVGETADRFWNVPNTEVIRNIKRWALASDPHVRDIIKWTFQKQESPWPEWFDHATRSIRLWDETVMTAEEAITQILKVAISRAGLAGAAAEWRAGCPVESDIIYRKALVSALDELGCGGKIKWVAEEPILLLALGKKTGALRDGRHIVYDMGGGSFDCAVVEVRGGDISVLAQEGLMLGGADMDEMLVEKFRKDGYTGSPQLVRIAKERLTPGNPVSRIEDHHELKLDHVEDVVRNGDFINKTMTAMANAYGKARIMFYDTYLVGGWHATIEEMVADINGVLLVGGPTRMGYFANELRQIFGDDKVITASELVQEANRSDIVDPELTALSHGASYLDLGIYAPLTVDRIPVNIRLNVTDGHSTEDDRYTAFQRLPFRRPLAPHEGRWVALDTEANKTYSVLVTDPDGEVLHESGPHAMRMPRDGYIGPRADRVKLIVDRLGGIKVRLGAGFTSVASPLEDVHEIIGNNRSLESEIRVRTATDDPATARTKNIGTVIPGSMGAELREKGRITLESFETTREAAR